MIIIYVVAGEVNAEKQFFVWGSLLLGLVAEAILAVAGHGSRKGIVLSYLPMSLIPFTLVQFMWASPTHMYDETVEEMGAEYADAMQPLFHGWLEAGMIALTLVIACFCVRFFVRERK